MNYEAHPSSRIFKILLSSKDCAINPSWHHQKVDIYKNEDYYRPLVLAIVVVMSPRYIALIMALIPMLRRTWYMDLLKSD